MSPFVHGTRFDNFFFFFDMFSITFVEELLWDPFDRELIKKRNILDPSLAKKFKATGLNGNQESGFIVCTDYFMLRKLAGAPFNPDSKMFKEIQWGEAVQISSKFHLFDHVPNSCYYFVL